MVVSGGYSANLRLLWGSVRVLLDAMTNTGTWYAEQKRKFSILDQGFRYSYRISSR